MENGRDSEEDIVDVAVEIDVDVNEERREEGLYGYPEPGAGMRDTNCTSAGYEYGAGGKLRVIGRWLRSFVFNKSISLVVTSRSGKFRRREGEGE